MTNIVIPEFAASANVRDLITMKCFCVYITTNRQRGVLYVGVTSELPNRTWQHKNHVVKGFTDKYNCDRLVYYEQTEDPTSAFKREKQLKRWRREWKIKLIEEENPEWKDLYDNLFK